MDANEIIAAIDNSQEIELSKDKLRVRKRVEPTSWPIIDEFNHSEEFKLGGAGEMIFQPLLENNLEVYPEVAPVIINDAIHDDAGEAFPQDDEETALNGSSEPKIDENSNNIDVEHSIFKKLINVPEFVPSFVPSLAITDVTNGSISTSKDESEKCAVATNADSSLEERRSATNLDLKTILTPGLSSSAPDTTSSWHEVRKNKNRSGSNDPDSTKTNLQVLYLLRGWYLYTGWIERIPVLSRPVDFFKWPRYQFSYIQIKCETMTGYHRIFRNAFSTSILALFRRFENFPFLNKS